MFVQKFSHPRGREAAEDMFTVLGSTITMTSSPTGWRYVTDGDVDREAVEMLARGHAYEAVEQAVEWMKAFLHGFRP